MMSFISLQDLSKILAGGAATFAAQFGITNVNKFYNKKKESLQQKDIELQIGQRQRTTDNEVEKSYLSLVKDLRQELLSTHSELQKATVEREMIEDKYISTKTELDKIKDKLVELEGSVSDKNKLAEENEQLMKDLDALRTKIDDLAMLVEKNSIVSDRTNTSLDTMTQMMLENRRAMTRFIEANPGVFKIPDNVELATT